MTRIPFLPAFLVAAATLLAGWPAIGRAAPAEPAELLMGSEIQALLAGNTVTGATARRGPFTDFYHPDGTVKGHGYTGSWTVENNALCLKLGGDDAKNCWQLGLKGNEIQWLKGGKVTGTATVKPGNPDNL